MRDKLSEIIEIDYHDLLELAIQKKREGYRLSQACAAYIDGKPQLSYSFADDENYKYVTLRCKIEKDTEIISLSEILPYAAFYENEMRELFGINIQLIEPDYKNKFYRINKETPFAPENKEQ
ncbi:MAG: NADH-quinone oxidoreductase subunit C [Firmicutes bacterium]|nr:NADH-quinone oxidoreductase subunit C [Bacillota bacterium]